MDHVYIWNTQRVKHRLFNLKLVLSIKGKLCLEITKSGSFPYDSIFTGPCDSKPCTGKNAICEVVFSTGQPKCRCPKAMTGDPYIACGNVLTHLYDGTLFPVRNENWFEIRTCISKHIFFPFLNTSISASGICKYCNGKHTTNNHEDYGKTIKFTTERLERISIIFSAVITQICRFTRLDGSDFEKFEYFDCLPKHGYYHDLTSAINECRNSTNCSMVSSTDCSNATATYHLCGPEPELRLIDPFTACTLRKKGILSRYINIKFGF